MQVHSIEKQNPNIGFKSDLLQEASNFVKMDNAQLKCLAYKNSFDKKEERENRKSVARTFYAIPIAETIAAGIIAPGTLGCKALSAGSTAGVWAGIIGLVGAYNLVKNAVTSKSPALQDFQQSHPFLSFLTDIGILSTSFFLGLKGLAKITERNPKLFENFAKNVKKVKDVIDASSFNKKILPKITEKAAKIAEKAPWAAVIGRFALFNSTLILLGVAVVKAIKHSKEKNEKVEQNYHALKREQAKMAKDLVNVLEVQNKVLIKNQKAMAKILRRTLNEAQAKPEIKVVVIPEKSINSEIISSTNEAEQDYLTPMEYDYTIKENVA